MAGNVEADVLACAIEPGHYQSFEVGDDGAVTEKPPIAQTIGEYIIVPIMFSVLLIIAANLWFKLAFEPTCWQVISAKIMNNQSVVCSLWPTRQIPINFKWLNFIV